MKAISKEPSGRYTTAQELADDLTRFCDDQPIRARRPTVLERGIRWIRRHRPMVVTGLTVFLLALPVGTTLVILQSRTTEAVSRDRLSYIKRSFPFIDEITFKAMGDVSMATIPSRRTPGQTDPAIEVYRKALQLYEQASRIPPTDPESRKIIARATHRVGFTRGVWSYRQGGNPSLRTDAELAFRKSLGLFESLQAEQPGDREVRSWYADALGEWGFGWFLVMTQRPTEAEPCYRQAIKLSRELALDPDVDVPTMSSELEKTARLAGTLGGMLDARGQIEDVRELWRDLVSACKSLTPRLSGPDGSMTSAGLAQALAQISGLPAMRREGRKECEAMFRLALSLDARNANALNNLAWFLASEADARPDNRAEALAAARLATELVPKEGGYWNTLGVIAYRTGDWKQAKEAIERSMSLHDGGDATDWLFLAMTCWQQEDLAAARKWLDRAKAWMKTNQPPNAAELKRFQAEAEALLGGARKPPASKAIG